MSLRARDDNLAVWTRAVSSETKIAIGYTHKLYKLAPMLSLRLVHTQTGNSGREHAGSFCSVVVLSHSM